MSRMLRRTWLIALAAVVVIAAVAVVMSNDGAEPASATGEVVDAPDCGVNTRGAWTGRPSSRDVRVGPLILRGANQWARWRPNAFGGHGYKIPAVLANGAVATLSVPEKLHGRVGLVYSAAAQELQRPGGTGVPGADASVRFAACPAGEAGRTGWTGGIVLDRPRCVSLVVKVDGRAPAYGRVPLGRPC